MDAKIDSGVQEDRLESWRDFGPWIERYYQNSPAMLYRGQANASWKIESTLDRLENQFPKKKNHWGGSPEFFNCPPAPRAVHLEAFKEAARGKRGVNPQDISEDEWWALAQHHGLATPLVDWTYSPFIALFFAFEENIRCCKAEEHGPDRVVFAVSFHLVDDKGKGNRDVPYVFSVRREVTNRLGSQSGVLMKMPPHTDLESSIRERFQADSSLSNAHARAVLRKIVIPDDGRLECLKHLNKMNINRMSLFPDLDGAAKYINSLWELDFDTAMGALPDCK